MKTLKIILLVLTVLAFLAFSFLFLAGKGVERTVLNEEFYEKVFDETELAAALSDNLAAALSEELLQDITGSSPEATENAVYEPVRETFDEDWIKENFPEFTGNMLAWLKGDSELEVFIELDDKKAQLQENVQDHMSSLSREELARMGLSPLEIEQIKSGNFTDITEDMSSEITVEDVFADDEAAASIEDRRSGFQTNYDRFRIWSYVALALFAGLFMFTAGVFSGLKWMGGIMFFTGLAAFAGPRIFSGLVFVLVSGQFEGSANAAVIEDTINVAVTEFTRPAQIYGAIGLVMLVIGIIAGRIYKRGKPDGNRDEFAGVGQKEEASKPADSQPASGIS